MTSKKIRSLPRVREALEKAERARFYKQRINRYTEDVRLERRLRRLESHRIMLLTQLKEEDMKLRMDIIHLRDEEKAFLESDDRMIMEVSEKIERNQKRNRALIDKYKSERDRIVLEEKRRKWATFDAADKWRWEIPKREAQIQVDVGLLYPKMKRRQFFKKMYDDITQRPTSRFGDKCLEHIRVEHESHDTTDPDVLFLRRLEQDFRRPPPLPTDDPSDKPEDPFITHSSALQAYTREQAVLQDQVLSRILHQIEQTRNSIRFWEPSGDIENQLSQCIVKKKRVVKHKRKKDKTTKKKKQLTEVSEEDSSVSDQYEEETFVELPSQVNSTDDDGSTQTSENSKLAEKRARRMSKRDKTVQMLSPVPSEGRTTPIQEADKEEDSLDKKLSALAKKLSKNFRPEDFKRRRQSLLQELEEEEKLSAAEREKKMQEFEEAWQQVLRCKYLRGYDPPEAILPNGLSSTEFVFGDEDGDIS